METQENNNQTTANGVTSTLRLSDPYEESLGEAKNLYELRDIIGSFVGECPIRFDTKAPIEIIYRFHNDYGELIFR